MSTGDGWKGGGPSSLRVNANPHLNCHVGMSFVIGYPSKKFQLPSWLLARLNSKLDSFESVTISGKVVALLMNLDTQLASSWVKSQGVATMNMYNQRVRDLDLIQEKLQ